MESSQTSSVFSGLSLGIIEIRRNGNDSSAEFIAERFFSALLEGAQICRLKFGRGLILPRQY
jgi:hypothetical protein